MKPAYVSLEKKLMLNQRFSPIKRAPLRQRYSVMFPVPPWQDEYNRREFPEEFNENPRKFTENRKFEKDRRRGFTEDNEKFETLSLYCIGPWLTVIIALVFLSQLENGFKLKISENGVKFKID